MPLLPLPILPAAVAVAKRELKMECDYRYELQSQQRFKQLVSADPYTSQVGGTNWWGETGALGFAGVDVCAGKGCSKQAIAVQACSGIGAGGMLQCCLNLPLPLTPVPVAALLRA